MTVGMLNLYTQYNLWANTSMMDWLSRHDKKLMDQEVSSSFPTINKTIAHMWFAEHIWLSRLKDQPFKSLEALAGEGDFDFVSQGLLQESALFVELLNIDKQTDTERLITYYREDEKYQNSFANITHHIMNHSTYHRGQLVTMARSLGCTHPPKTDYLQYIREL